MLERPLSEEKPNARRPILINICCRNFIPLLKLQYIFVCFGRVLKLYFGHHRYTLLVLGFPFRNRKSPEIKQTHQTEVSLWERPAISNRSYADCVKNTVLTSTWPYPKHAQPTEDSKSMSYIYLICYFGFDIHWPYCVFPSGCWDF